MDDLCHITNIYHVFKADNARTPITATLSVRERGLHVMVAASTSSHIRPSSESSDDAPATDETLFQLRPHLYITWESSKGLLFLQFGGEF